MRYLGGKYRIRQHVAEVVARYGGGRPVWEPCCGGLNSAGAHEGPVWCSDAEESLIALYRAVAAGWDPPAYVSEETYRAAKALAVTDPLHGFCAYGCSFGGKRWGGFASDDTARNYARSARAALLRDVGKIALGGGSFFLSDFLSIDPQPHGCVLYLDPPYRGTTGYGMRFDHDLLLERVLDWALYGPVLVSEYDLPIGVEVWSKERNAELRGKAQTRTEKIFLLDRRGA